MLQLPFKWISPAGCILALAGFFLVFTDVNCNGKTLDTITGIEMATGYQPEIDLVEGDDNEEQQKDTEKYDPNIFALNALMAAIIGIILFAIPGMRKQHALHAIVAAIGFVSMLLLYFNLQSEIKKAQSGENSTLNLNLNITFDMQPAYWLVMLCFLITLIADILLWRQSSAHNASADTPAPTVYE